MFELGARGSYVDGCGTRGFKHGLSLSDVDLRSNSALIPARGEFERFLIAGNAGIEHLGFGVKFA